MHSHCNSVFTCLYCPGIWILLLHAMGFTALFNFGENCVLCGYGGF